MHEKITKMSLYWIYCITYIAGFQIISASQLQYSGETSKDVCLTEDLDIRCNYKEVIVITHALYGHLYQGRCIPRATVYLGCQANIIDYLDDKCSGKRSCTLSMLEPSLRSLEPECAVGLTSFIEYKYICVQGHPTADFCRILPVQQTPSYIYSLSTSKADCIKRDDSAYLTMAASEGQKIKLKIIDLNLQFNTTVVQNLYIIQENGRDISLNFTTSNNGFAESEYTSKKSTVTVMLKNVDHNALIIYQATGCLDLVTPHNMWTNRNKDSVTVGCYSSDQTWTLSCLGTKWIGGLGNCTAKTAEPPKEVPVIVLEEDKKELVPEPILSKEIWLTIILVATLLSCGTVLLIGFICVKLAKRKYGSDKNYERCEMVPLDANLRPIRNGDITAKNWQQTMSSQGNNLTSNRNMAVRNNSSPLILMDQDLITINGISNT